MTPTKKNRLTKLAIDELSLVTRPANQGSFSVLYKSDDDMDTETPTEGKGLFAALKKYFSRSTDEPNDEIVTFAKEFPEASVMVEALETSLGSILLDDALTSAQKAEAIRKSSQEFCDAAVGTVVKGEETTPPNDTALVGEEPMSKTAEDVLKGLAPEVVELITKAQTDAAAAKEALEKMQKDAEEKATLEIAKSMVGTTSVKPEDVALVLKQLDEPGRKVVEAVFAQANAILKNGVAVLTAEIGKDGNPVTAVTKLDQAAEELRKADPKLTKEQAITKAMEANPRLYDEHLAGR